MSERGRGASIFPRDKPSYQCFSGAALFPRLEEMDRSPVEVHLWGELPPGPYVSIVGTRRATNGGLAAAGRLAQELAERGVTVLSGGAVGIDSAAHEGALSVGGRTVVVAPSWWCKAFPESNKGLFRRIVDGGGGYLTLSQKAAPLLNPSFFRRNEALVALSHAVVLGECPLRSGAKNAMMHARRLNRPRFVLPGVYGHDTWLGAVQEVQEFRAEILGGPSRVFDQLREEGEFDNPRWWDYLESIRLKKSVRSSRRSCRVAQARNSEREVGPALEGREVQDVVGAAIFNGLTTVDAICEGTGLSPQEVQHRIAFLTLKGSVAEDEAGLLRYHSPQT